MCEENVEVSSQEGFKNDKFSELYLEAVKRKRR